MSNSSETSTLSFLRSEKRVNRTDLAYIAGFFDGEGSISAKWKNEELPFPRAILYNTDRSVLIWIADHTGGRLYHQPPRLGTKQLYSLEIRTSDLLWFLKLMIPFLKIKQRQARVALVLRSIIERKGSVARRIKWAQELSRLNKGR
jgi:hypothetical protein